MVEFRYASNSRISEPSFVVKAGTSSRFLISIIAGIGLIPSDSSRAITRLQTSSGGRIPRKPGVPEDIDPKRTGAKVGPIPVKFMTHSPGFLKLVDDAKTRVKEITIADARKRLSANPNAVLIDVRED